MTVSEALFLMSVGYFGWGEGVSVALFLVDGAGWGVWDIILDRWELVGVGGALFWVGGSGWENILDG